MFKEILKPTQQNSSTWLSSIYLLVLVCFGFVNPITILFVYFLETIIIGIFNIFKMYVCGVYSKTNAIGFILFFIVHYFFFVAIQSIFGFSIFSMGDDSLFKEPFYLLENYGIILSMKDVYIALPAIIFNNLGKFLFDFLKNQKYVDFTVEEMLFKPYVRIFIQQFVVLISMFFVILSKNGIIAAIILILIRCFVDLTLDAIKRDSKVVKVLATKLSNDKVDKKEVEKQLLLFSE